MRAFASSSPSVIAKWMIRFRLVNDTPVTTLRIENMSSAKFNWKRQNLTDSHLYSMWHRANWSNDRKAHFVHHKRNSTPNTERTNWSTNSSEDFANRNLFCQELSHCRIPDIHSDAYPSFGSTRNVKCYIWLMTWKPLGAPHLPDKWWRPNRSIHIRAPFHCIVLSLGQHDDLHTVYPPRIDNFVFDYNPNRFFCNFYPHLNSLHCQCNLARIA